MKNNYLKHTFSILLAIILFLGCQWFVFSLSKLIAKAQQTEVIGYDAEPTVSASASSYDPNLYLKENYATYYFSNLTSNFGYNAKGSCGYIALGMLLSYFDTYWDDNIISDEYDAISEATRNQIMTEAPSPGIRNDYHLLSSLWPSNEFYYENVVKKYSNEYFHLKLIQMGQEQFNYYNSDEYFPCGLSAAETETLTKYYLYNYIGYTKDEVSILKPSSTKQKDVRQFTISRVKQGIPVILLGTAGSDDAHFAVAYDYNESTDSIYVHMGMTKGGAKNNCHNNFELAGYSLYGAFAIQFNTEHNHSENIKRRINSSYVETDCPCELSFHPAHAQVVDNHISVKEVCETGTAYRDFAAIKKFDNAMIIELDLSTWLAENNALPSEIKEIKLKIQGKLQESNCFTITDIKTLLPLNIVQRQSYVNIDYITFVPDLNSNNRVRLLVESTSDFYQSYSVYGMSFSVTTI